MLCSIITGLITFLFIFGWKINLLADLILLVSAGLIATSFIRGYFFADRNTLTMAAGLGILSIYSLAIVIMNGVLDTQIAMRSIRALLNFFGALALANIYYRRSESDFGGIIIRDIYLALTAHAALMLAMYLNQSLRLAIYRITDAESYVNLTSSFLDGYRISGLTYGLSQTSVLQMLGLLLLPLTLRDCKSYFGKMVLLAGAPLLVVSILISGRSGLMLGMAFLPICITTLLWKRTNGKSPGSAISEIVKGTAILAAIAIAFTLLSSRMPGKFDSYSLAQAREILDTIKLKGTTVENLSGMLILPESWPELFFGSSNLGRGELDYIPSDIGWIKTIFAIGLVGTLLMLFPYLLALRVAAQFFRSDLYLATASSLIFFSALLLNSKELALLTRTQWSIHSLLLCMLCLKLQQGVARQPTVNVS
ncbi:MAG: hypothetical protein CVV41_22175 [Candidatus Riflebacteria bacterium HGW-Riflebacteria-1]|jgi:hypothetical protein|nr:MAG: hypothetical protein CVV41_22175 [Candidatus Riflebacteria bacterium HGW-Riflebacteria-1]